MSAPRTLFAFFERAAALYPDSIAIDVPPSHSRRTRSTISYAELRRQVAALVSHLRAVARADAILAILLPRDSIRLYVAQLAVLESGAAYTCIDPAFPEERLRFILDDCEAVLLLTDAAGAMKSARSGFDSARVLDVESLMAKPAANLERQLNARTIAPTDLAYVIYTSGTSGRPKGVLIEQHSIANLVASDLEYFALTPRDRVVQGSSPAYDSSIEESWLAFAAGATLLVMDEETSRSGPDLVAWLRNERATVFCPPPTLLRASGCEDPASALPALRLLYVGGEALPLDLAERWSRGRRLENGYGPTECTVTSVRGPFHSGGPVTIGRAVSGIGAHVLDEHFETCGEGELGELCLSGVGLARGYLHRPELDAEKFPLHPRLGRIYRTGDLARKLPNGELECLGRIDSQVKLRGHRIELEDIDAHLSRCAGVRSAASRVQGEGAGQILVACVVALRADAPPRVEEIKAALRRSLPESMTPSRIVFVETLPTSTGGKLDRAALPFVDAPAHDRSGPVLLARDPLERAIADTFRATLEIEQDIDIDADFFDDLGGNSLRAAMTVSRLRGDPRTASLAVRDLYDARSVSHLAERARAADPAEEAPQREAPRAPGRPGPVAVIQGLWLCARLLVASLGLYVAVFELTPFLFESLGALRLAILVPLAAPIVFALYAWSTLRWAVFVKERLIGHYVPLRAPIWGSFFLRNWIVQQAVRSVPWRLLQGTEFQNAALRRLGATIGERVHLHRGVDLLEGGFDLLTLGDDVAVAQDATLRLVELEDGKIHVGAVTLEAGASLGTRADVAQGCRLERDAQLSASSALSAGSRIAAGERWDGVPATRAGASHAANKAQDARAFSPYAHATSLVLARLAVSCVVAYLPAILFAIAALTLAGIDSASVTQWLLAPTLEAAVFFPAALLISADVLLSLILRAALCRVLGRISPGTVPIRSAAFLRATLKTELVDAASYWLSGTLFWPVWLRAAGMRVGKDCEVSTIIDVVPELVEIGSESFLADGIYLGGARLDRGCATFAKTELGRDTFVGNHAVIPGGAILPDDVLIGVSTNADPARIRAGTSWFGHPAFQLPRGHGEEADKLGRHLTHSPGALRFSTRVFWELLRFALPTVPLFVALLWYELACSASIEQSPWFTALVLVPAATLGAAVCLCAVVLAMKWLLLGRVKPGRHALWSCWCSRWDFHYVAWTQYAHAILSQLEGTLLLPWYLRAMGCRIGKRTVLGAGFAQVVDPDMLVIEDEATVVGMFQAHSFEDRVLKIDRITIRRRATVGAGAVLFYGCDIGAGAEVAPHSVVMKHERLLPGRFYAGCPTRSYARPVPAALVAESMPQSSGSPVRTIEERWPALDTARGLALLGMMYVHLVPAADGGPLWQRLVGGVVWLLEAKSAALFCTTVGFSIALLTARAGGSRRLDFYLLRRALALFVLGYALAATYWTTEVLRPLACMTLLAGMAARLRPRYSIVAILALLAATPVLTQYFANFYVGDWTEDGVHTGALRFDMSGLRYLFFDGNYPLIPWLAFPLLGVLLASVGFSGARAARRAFFGFSSVAVLLQIYAALSEDRAESFGSLAPHLLLNWGANGSPTSIPLMISAGSTAGAILTALVWWQFEGPRPKSPSGFFRAFGRATLTHYLLHLAIAYALLYQCFGDHDWPMGAGLLAFVLYIAFMTPLTQRWFKTRQQGPLEALLARVAGRYRD